MRILIRDSGLVAAGLGLRLDVPAGEPVFLEAGIGQAGGHLGGRGCGSQGQYHTYQRQASCGHVAPGAIISASHAPWKGAGSLAGGEQSDPPEYCNKLMRPGRGAGNSCNPCRGAYRCFSATQGLASLTPG